MVEVYDSTVQRMLFGQVKGHIDGTGRPAKLQQIEKQRHFLSEGIHGYWAWEKWSLNWRKSVGTKPGNAVLQASANEMNRRYYRIYAVLTSLRQESMIQYLSRRVYREKVPRRHMLTQKGKQKAHKLILHSGMFLNEFSWRRPSNQLQF